MEKVNKFCNSSRVISQLHEAIYRINVGADLSPALSFAALREALMYDDAVNRGVLMGVLLNGLMAKRPNLDEVSGFLRAAFSIDGYKPEELPEINLGSGIKVIGMAGSGKKGIKTMNISSCAAILAASLGVYIAKPCSSSTSSVTGSSDFVTELGVDVNTDNKRMKKILKNTGLGFFKIENRIPKFDSLYGGKFYAPNVLSFGLAGMTLPFKPNSFLYGLAHPNIRLLAAVLTEFGYKNAMVVSSTDDGVHYLDEVSVFGVTNLVGNKGGTIGETIQLQTAAELGLPRYSREDIEPGANVFKNVKFGLDVLRGKRAGAREDMVCVNAATLIYLAGMTSDLKSGFRMAKRQLRTQLPFKKLMQFIHETGGDETKIKKFL